MLAGAAASIEVEDKDTNRGGHEGGGIREGDRRGGRGVEEARNHRRNDVAKALYRREDPERRAAHLVRRERGLGRLERGAPSSRVVLAIASSVASSRVSKYSWYARIEPSKTGAPTTSEQRPHLRRLA